MGNKSVCINCKITFSYGMDYNDIISRKCPQCRDKMINVNYKFEAPKKSRIKEWEAIKYLLENGFYFQHIYDENNRYVKYPKNIKDAKIFVEKFRSQKINGVYTQQNDEMY